MRKNFYLFLLLAGLVFTGASCVGLGSTAQGPMGIFKSSDAGSTWEAKSVFPTAKGVMSLSGLKVYRIFTDPGDNNALYVGSRGQGLFYSYNGGDSWQSADAMAGKFIYGLSVDPKNKCVIYVTDGPHIYKSSDCLRTWKLIFTEERTNERFVALAVDYGASNTVYGALLGGDVLRSTDGGNSWRIVKRFNFELRHLAADPSTPRRIYVASYGQGLYRSDDGGDEWKNLSESFKDYSESLSFYRFVFNPARKDGIFWVSKYGVLKSNDAGETWTDLKLLTPPGSVNIYGFAVNPRKESEIYYTGTILGDKNQNVRSTLYKTSDGGESWVTKKLPTNTIPVDILVHPENGGVFMGFTTL